MADRREHVLELAVGGRRVVDVVGDDDRQAELCRQRRRFRHQPVVVGQQVVRQLDEEAVRRRAIATPEDAGIALGRGARSDPIAHPQPTGDLPVPAAGQGDHALVLGFEQLMMEAGHGLGASKVRVGDEPAQAAPAGRRPGQQEEMRAADAIADAAEVLLDRVPVPRQLRPLWSRSVGPALDGEWRLGGPFGSASTRASAWCEDDCVGVGNGRVEQVDLRTDHPMDPDLLGRAHEPDRAVQSVVIGDGQCRKALGDGPFHEIVGRRGTIEEREVGVRVELGVRSRRHVDRLDPGASEGLDSIERMFISCR